MEPQQVIGRYALFDAIAAGGMATVHYGRLLGPVGFARTVAIKQLHPQFARDPDFVSMFVDEARLAAKLRHPNVVPVLDVVKHGRELYIIMDYVLGVSLSEILRRLSVYRERIPVPVVVAILCGALEGLHAAHETRDEAGNNLGIVHRDVSPANILVGGDGLARVLDFGIAKAVGRAQVTRHGEVKGKVGYMAPEQLRGDVVSRAADIFAVAVTLWEGLTGQRGFTGDAESVIDARLAGDQLAPLASVDSNLAPFDAIIRRGTAQYPEDRYATAREMAEALAAAHAPATTAAVANWVQDHAGEVIEERGRVVAALEAGASGSEVRAAIRKDLSFDEPSVRVETWSGSEEELAGLWDRSSAGWDTADPEQRGDDALSSSTSDASHRPGRSRAARDDVATTVESISGSGSVRPPAPAPSVPLPLQAPAARFDDSTTRINEPDSTPPWLEESRSPTPVPPPPRSWPMWAVVGATAALVVGGVAAFMVLRSDTTAPAPAIPPPIAAEPASPSSAEDRDETNAHDDRVSGTPLPAIASADGDGTGDEDAANEGAGGTVPTSSAVPKPPVVVTPPRPVVPPSPKSKDPFDALGGRH